jgi:hypothetical protein
MAARAASAKLRAKVVAPVAVVEPKPEVVETKPEVVETKPEVVEPKSVPAKLRAKTEAAAAAAAKKPVATAAATKKPRVQLSTVLSINISQARCATHLKQNLGDAEIEREIKALRADLKAAKAAGTDQTEIKAAITEKSKSLVRISSETPIAAAVIWDGAVKEILCHGMDQAIACDRKIVDSAHLHSGDPETLMYYPLYNKCEIWQGYDPSFEDALKKKRATTNKALREEKKKAEAKAAETKAPTEKKAAAKTAVAEVPSEEEHDEEEDHASKTTFYTYVENALKTVKKNELYKSMRVSNRVREYLSELVAQGIARQAMLAQIIVQRVMGVRTMNAGHVKAVVHVLMADEGRSEEQIEHITAQIDEKLSVYSEHLKAEKDKKIAAQDEETKIENEYKRSESDLLRKKKQAEAATKRAADAAAKAKELFDEASTLEPIVAANKAKIVVKPTQPAEEPAATEEETA